MPSRGEVNSIVSDLPGKSPKTIPQDSYLKEAEKIIHCSKQMSARTGSKDDIFTKETVDGLAGELKRIAESPQSDRGAPYLSDVANSFCSFTHDPALVNYKKSNPDQELFEIILNFHLRQWDRAMSIEGQLEKFTSSKLSSSLSRDLVLVRTSTQKVIIGVVSAFLAMIFFVLALLYVGYQALLRYLLAFSEVTDISGVLEKSEPIKPESLKISMNGGAHEN
ncbi:MAG: hypothetical protein WCQ52_07250 [Actinomycetes bacterium]